MRLGGVEDLRSAELGVQDGLRFAAEDVQEVELDRFVASVDELVVGTGRV